MSAIVAAGFGGCCVLAWAILRAVGCSGGWRGVGRAVAAAAAASIGGNLLSGLWAPLGVGGVVAAWVGMLVASWPVFARGRSGAGRVGALVGLMAAAVHVVLCTIWGVFWARVSGSWVTGG